ncbi:heat shock 70 kDa protein 12A-like [Dreissena polymorpha]|uniref:Uncharacterized protein n=1 Tax=Dreissena polymorpha TaxID=45954 RepID=A0A9D4C685_DREPO|nr:heat shock 70 kDa protein 12A-like [Dreissena polymorpha]XP_052246740.1 heat shock 70 kDa protein 12A-like [Dreissena polymorpha]XP_052246741.1 heat shock 70 kDa protein 12A-like [Dreissena polymorpha]KAH3717970.1 hypothetical protein DPMN_060767 [Dreissena polymorpha]
MELEKPILVAFELGIQECGNAFVRRSSINELLHGTVKSVDAYRIQKEPSSILLDPMHKLISFGFEARERYALLEKQDTAQGWILLNEFIAFLQEEQDLSRSTTIQDAKGNLHSAFQIIAQLLRYLKNKALTILEGEKETDVQYVITIPGGLNNETAKLFVIDAAKEAGIDPEVLTIAMEKEVAALWSAKVNTRLKDELKANGSKFLVIDTEGENVEMNLFETLINGSIRRLDLKRASHCGGGCIDKQLIEFLYSHTDFGASNPVCDIKDPENEDLINHFQSHKNTFDGLKSVTVRPPLRLLHSFRSSEYATVISNKIKIKATIVKQWFKLCVTSILKCLRHFITSAKAVRVILMTGALGRCPYIQRQILLEYSNVVLIEKGEIVDEVLRGALISVMTVYETSPAAIQQNPTIQVVGAFDIGTTYSGYAFSFIHNPRKVQTKNWYACGPSAALTTLKAPTCVLLNPEGQFHSFGFEAENHIASLDSRKGWRLFRHFKMILHGKKALSRRTTIEDLSGDSHPAMPIFSMAIRYLYEQLLEAVRLQVPEMPEACFKYVVTVPAIWDDNAKQFMREAAINAGIDGHRLKMVLEPEVAPLWYMNAEGNQSVQTVPVGSKYMVVDLGGGTADVSIQERLPYNQIRVIQKASGGPWGGTCVDKNFIAFLETTFAKHNFAEFQKNELCDYFDLLQSFETKKRSKSDSSFYLRIPMSLNTSINSKTKTKLFTFRKAKKQNPIERDKLPIDSSTFVSWFAEPTDMLIMHIKKQCLSTELNDLRTVMLVGGFAESTFVQEKIRRELPEIRLVVPEDAGLAVLKGAVIYGHNPSLVASRIMPYTYGIECLKLFDPKKHFGRIKTNKDGKWLVRSFRVFVKINEQINENHRVTYSFNPVSTMPCTCVYRTVLPDPEFVTDKECELLGTLSIRVREDVPLGDQTYNVTFMFGDTELLVIVKDTTTGKEDQLTLNCLE